VSPIEFVHRTGPAFTGEPLLDDSPAMRLFLGRPSRVSVPAATNVPRWALTLWRRSRWKERVSVCARTSRIADFLEMGEL
jgi:hypothetical protein